MVPQWCRNLRPLVYTPWLGRIWVKFTSCQQVRSTVAVTPLVLTPFVRCGMAHGGSFHGPGPGPVADCLCRAHVAHTARVTSPE